MKMMCLVGEGKKAEHLTMRVKLLKAADDKVCIDIQREEGDVFTFFKQFNVIEDFLGELVDAT